jgi:predicted amidohydrolase
VAERAEQGTREEGALELRGTSRVSDFKVAAAQVASIRGDIEANIAAHAAAIEAAAEHEVSVLIFPELSLTGYEPDLAAELAMSAVDSRLEPLRALARQHHMKVVVGAPLHGGTSKPALGAIVIDASGSTTSYRKMHLGTSERAIFVAGDRPLAFTVSGHTVGVAICADSSQPTHPQANAALGANIYAAGVFLNVEWYGTDVPRLMDYAARFRMLTVMANHADSIGTYVSVGKSAAWAPGGALLAKARGVEPALVIATNTNSAWRGEVIGI